MEQRLRHRPPGHVDLGKRPLAARPVAVHQRRRVSTRGPPAWRPRCSALARLLCNGCCAAPRSTAEPVSVPPAKDYLASVASICMSKGHRRQHKGDSADRLLQHMLGKHPTWISRRPRPGALHLHARMI